VRAEFQQLDQGTSILTGGTGRQIAQNIAISGEFLGSAQLLVCDPYEWIKPVQRAQHRRQHICRRVPVAGVTQFVEHYVGHLIVG
jgi:hypothetical protein